MSSPTQRNTPAAGRPKAQRSAQWHPANPQLPSMCAEKLARRRGWLWRGLNKALP